jgi:hypothetical protein
MKQVETQYFASLLFFSSHALAWEFILHRSCGVWERRKREKTQIVTVGSISLKASDR